jgi:hypothetical protein
MKQAIHTRPVTIYLSEADFNKVKKITDDERISFAQWFRAATKLKLEQDIQEENNESNQR